MDLQTVKDVAQIIYYVALSIAGPLALRALADLRPGPRHVRNLCALVLRPL
jgi:hypothetical protein